MVFFRLAIGAFRENEAANLRLDETDKASHDLHLILGDRGTNCSRLRKQRLPKPWGGDIDTAQAVARLAAGCGEMTSVQVTTVGLRRRQGWDQQRRTIVVPKVAGVLTDDTCQS